MTQAFVAAFSGTAIEFFETVVIALAVLRAGYPREAISAIVIGHAAVFAFATALYPLHDQLPLYWMRLMAAGLLTLMGLHWTLKSIRRLLAHQRPRWAQDPLGKVNVAPVVAEAIAFSPFVFLVMAKSSVIEAGEILLVVFPIAAATRDWMQAILGVTCGIGVVSVLAVLLHGRLQKVPEVKLKLVAGVLLLFLGGAWVAEILRG